MLAVYRHLWQAAVLLTWASEYPHQNLKVRSTERKKVARRQRVPQAQALGPKHCWSADCVSDKLADRRTIRILTVIDQFTRECIWMEAGTTLFTMKASLGRELRSSH
jgi:hypothetical protein